MHLFDQNLKEAAMELAKIAPGPFFIVENRVLTSRGENGDMIQVWRAMTGDYIEIHDTDFERSKLINKIHKHMSVKWNLDPITSSTFLTTRTALYKIMKKK